MDFLINKIAVFNEINVIGIFKTEDAEQFYLLKIKKNKSNLDVLATTTYDDLESLCKNLDKKVPLLLVVDGKGVLTKKIDLKNETDIQWIKNLDYSSIHFTSYDTNDNQFLSFCRKNVAEDCINTFKKKGFQILDFYIGSIISVLLNITLKKSKIFSNESILNIENDELIEVVKSREDNNLINYEIGNKQISNFHLPLYSATVHLYIKQKSVNKSNSELINNEEIIYKKAFDKLGIVMIIGFFIMLLISYFLTQYYTSKNTELNLENVYSNQTFELIQKLEAQKENKINILNETGISSSKFISFYSYEIAKSVSSQINLSEINVFPVENEIKENKKVDFTTKLISIKGSTNNEEALNSWFENVRSFNWIKNLEIVSIKKDKKNITFFELKITLKNV